MVVTWLRHDWENRHTHASSLLKEVRLGLVPEEKLKELLDPNILEITECRELYEKVQFFVHHPLYCVSQKERVWGNQQPYLKMCRVIFTLFLIFKYVYYLGQSV